MHTTYSRPSPPLSAVYADQLSDSVISVAAELSETPFSRKISDRLLEISQKLAQPLGSGPASRVSLKTTLHELAELLLISCRQDISFAQRAKPLLKETLSLVRILSSFERV
jgi:CRP-like cAMP-binding protein